MEKRGKQPPPSQGKEHQIQFGMVQPMSSAPTNFMSKKSTGAYDFGELDQGLFLYLDGQDHSSTQEQKHTLNIFPSQPMHAVEPSSNKNCFKERNSLSTSTTNSTSKRAATEQTMELAISKGGNSPSVSGSAGKDVQLQQVKRETSKKAVAASCSSEHEGPKTPDTKALRRLAQNREAARKSRLRKKAYIQQLESSRIKLSQLEQELQRARAQGVFLGGGGIIGDQGFPGGINSAAAIFDMEYGRWLEEQQRVMYELRAAVQEELPEKELRMFVESILSHYDQMMALKSAAVKTDVFHLLSGMWKTPAERCFLWIGGFRPSHLIKIVVSHMEPLSEQQIIGICGLQQSTQETEDALTQGLEALYQSLSDAIVSDDLTSPSNVANYMALMALALNKLASLEDFVRQADNLRQQTLHRLHQLLTTPQAARCFLAIAEYFHRLRALSSLWLARPRHHY